MYAVLLPPTDCNGITGGTALVDSCGTCQQAYIYNFQTNVPTFVDSNIIAGVDYNPSIEALIYPDNPNNPLWINDPSLCSNTIYDIVSNSSDHTTLKTAIDACSLDGVLTSTSSLTLFAPTDAAFNLLPAGTITALLNDIPQLTNIFKAPCCCRQRNVRNAIKWSGCYNIIRYRCCCYDKCKWSFY